MKTRRSQSSALLLSLFLISSTVHAKGNGVSGGLTLLEAPGARASALGEAFTATVDDVAAFAYNPSMLKSLKTGQASFLHQKGLLDDAFSQFIVGSPWRQMGLGLSIGYYNGGDFEMSDGVSQRTVTAQRDLTVALGAARSFGGVSIGFTGKYLSSELVETERATAFAADLGLNYAVSPRLSLGGALQNYGTQLKYASEGDNLPRIFRMGGSYNVLPQYGTVLMFDVQRLMNEGETRPALGVETRVGPLALRAGYRQARGGGEFSTGTGFAWGRSALDYSFGLMNKELDARQKISYTFRFGGNGGANARFSRSSVPATPTASVPAVAPKVALATAGDQGREKMEKELRSSAPAIKAPLSPVQARVPAAKRMYTVQAGDTLAKIAQANYGDHRMWRSVYLANRHLIPSPTEIEKGQRIALP